MHNQTPLTATLPKTNVAIKVEVERKRTVTHMDTIPESNMEEIRVSAIKEIIEEQVKQQGTQPV